MKKLTLQLTIITIIFSLPNFAQNLEVASGGQLYISPTAFVYISNSGNVNINSSGELIMDSVSNDFSDFYVDGTSSGNAEYRHFTASVATRDLVSPPVSGQAFSAFATDNSGKIAGGTLTPANLLYGPLDNINAVYIEYAAGDATTLAPAKGYRAGSVGGQTLSYTGAVNTADVAIELTFGTGQFKESNLVGNPFTTHINSGILVTTLGNSSAIDPTYAAIYGYDGSATTDVTTWKIINNLSPNELITPGQGFILISSADGGTFTFPESAREVSATAQDDFILGRQVSNTPFSFKLKLSKGSNIYQTSLYFIDTNGTRGLDVTYDAGSLGSDIGTHLVEDSQGLNLAIQVLSTADLTATDYAIPVEVNLAAGQQATISIDDLNVPSGTEFYLDDRLLNTQTLLNTDSYSFTTASNLSGIGRFYIGTSPNTLSTPLTALNTVEILSIRSSKQLSVRGQLYSDSILNLYDVRGRVIETYQLEASQTEHLFDVSHITPGVYIVNLDNNNQSKTTKLVIN